MPVHIPNTGNELPTNATATLPLVHQALSQIGAAGAILDELLDAMTADGYQGDRMAVWVAVCAAKDQGTVSLSESGRCWAAGYGP
jgi:hypothetical protein